MTLNGSTVVVTRAIEQAEEFGVLLRARGAAVIFYPTIAVSRVHGAEAEIVARALASLAQGTYDAVLIASLNAAEWLPADPPSGPVYFCVGPRTAQRVGPRAIVAEPSNSAGLIATVLAHYGDVRGRRFLFLRAREGRRDVVDVLTARGAVVDALVGYETVPLVDGPKLPTYLQVDWLTFASPSAVQAFVQRTEPPPLVRVACIGQTTAMAARALHLTVHVTPSEPTFEALVEAMDAY